MKKKGDWIQTFTGKEFWFLEPDPESIDIIDIAHSLSMQCRNNGHAHFFYSVAEHSIWVSMLVEPEHQLAALLHDASEAYLADIPSPIKPFLSNYKEIENNLQAEINKKFGCALTMHESIHKADKEILVNEMEFLLSEPPRPWNDDGKYNAAKDITLVCMEPNEAKLQFLRRYDELTKGI